MRWITVHPFRQLAQMFSQWASCVIGLEDLLAQLNNPIWRNGCHVLVWLNILFEKCNEKELKWHFIRVYLSKAFVASNKPSM